jgi:hypothetical protein
MTENQKLGNLSDEELAEIVRKTPQFRAAVACAVMSEEVTEIAENQPDVYKQLLNDTHDRQGSSVSSHATTTEIVDTFLNVISDYADLAENPDKGGEAVVDGVVQDQ